MRTSALLPALFIAASASAQVVTNGSWTTTLTSESGGTQTKVSWNIDNYSFSRDWISTTVVATSFGGFASYSPTNVVPFSTLPATTTFAVNTGITYRNTTTNATASVDSLKLELIDIGSQYLAYLLFHSSTGLAMQGNEALVAEGTTTGYAIIDVPYSTFNTGTWTDYNMVLVNAAPIPEPSTYGLMLGGLALAGAAIRRRKISK